MTYYSYITSSSQDLEHHGILGMKWGVRRYQNKDGSLTAAGKRRYEKADRKRNEYADQAARRSESYKSLGRDASKTLQDLNKEGHKGKTMQRMYGDDIKDDKRFKDIYGESVKSVWESEMYELSEHLKTYESASKSWMKYHDELMSMDINGLSANEVSKKAKEKLHRILNESV